MLKIDEIDISKLIANFVIAGEVICFASRACFKVRIWSGRRMDKWNGISDEYFRGIYSVLPDSLKER